MISGVLMALLMWWYQYVPTWRVLALPFFALLALAAATAAGLWISALTVKFRDFRIIIPFVVQFGFFISPVGYDSSAVPDEWRALYSFNPLVGIIDGFRWALLRDPKGFLLPGLILSVLVIAILLITGFWFFRRTEREVADII
jgi:lipopolysaccharide transport system permease protein